MRQCIAILLMFFFAIAGCGPGPGDDGISESPEYRNVILLIGDGMGEAHRTAARWFLSGINGKLAMDELTYHGMAVTASAGGGTTDSAAAATAIATGVKTDNGVVGLDTELNMLTTVLEKAQKMNKSVGLVTTTHITHATPAAFAAHVKDRWMMTEIADQMLESGVDVLFGGGEDEFLPADEEGCYPEQGERDDGRNLISEFREQGYLHVCDLESFMNTDPNAVSRVLGLFADEEMARPFTPSLREMTQKAINILSQNPAGFFLMVEGGLIDWASHYNEGINAINDTIGLDEAVDAALTYASMHTDTLVIVTADHETGGMNVDLTPDGPVDEYNSFFMPDGTPFYVTWSSNGHTNRNVPVTSWGPYASLLTGVYDNIYIHEIMLKALNGQ